jgi:hypothetical protein
MDTRWSNRADEKAKTVMELIGKTAIHDQVHTYEERFLIYK